MDSSSSAWWSLSQPSFPLGHSWSLPTYYLEFSSSWFPFLLEWPLSWLGGYPSGRGE
jgi:hypothetical protein